MNFRLVLILVLAMIPLGPAFGQSLEANRDFALAADHYRNSRWSLAIDGFKQLIKNHPNDEKSKLATFFLGEAALSERNYRLAKTELTNFLKQLPKHSLAPRARFRLGECHYLLGEDPAAIKYLTDSVKEKGGDLFQEFSLLYLGEMLQKSSQQKDVQQGLNYLLQGLGKFRASPLSDRYRFTLAKCYQKLGQSKEALRFFEFLQKSTDKALAAKAIIAIGSMHVGTQKWNQVAQTLNDQAWASFPENLKSEAMYWRGRAEMGRGNWDLAAQLLAQSTRHLEESLLNQAAHYDAAVSYLRAKKVDLADQYATASVSKWPEGRWIAGVSFLSVQIAKQKGDLNEVMRRSSNLPEGIYLTNQWAMIQETAGRAVFAAKQYDTAAIKFQALNTWTQQKGIDQAFAKKWQPTWLYLQGVSQINSGNPAEAIKNLKLTSLLTQGKTSPQDLWLYQNSKYAVSSHFVKQGHWKQAAEINETLLSGTLSNDLKLRVLADQIRCRGMLGDSGALAGLQAELKKLKGTAGGNSLQLAAYAGRQQELSALQIAQRRFQEKNWKEAAKWFRIAADSSDSEVARNGLSGLAWCQFQLGAVQGEDAFKMLQLHHPKSPYTAEIGMSYVQQFLDERKFEEAAELSKRLVEDFTEWKNYHYILSMAAKSDLALGRRQGLRPAMAKLEKAISLQNEAGTKTQTESDKLAKDRYRLAWVYHDLKRDQSAATQFESIYRSSPSSVHWPESAYRFGLKKYQQNSLQQADAIWSEVLAKKEAGAKVSGEVYAHTLFMKSMVAVRKANWEEVGRRTRLILETLPDSPLNHQAGYWHGESLYRQGKYQQAKEILIDVLPRTRGIQDAWAPMTHLRLAQALAQQGEWGKCKEVALGIENQYPNFPLQFEADCLIGRSFAIDAEFDQARRQYQKVLGSERGRSTETAAMAQWLIGESYFHQEEYQKAANEYHKCQTLYPYPKWKAVSLLQAGKCYEQMGRNDLAKGYFRQIVQNHPESSLAKKASNRLANLNSGGPNNRLTEKPSNSGSKR